MSLLTDMSLAHGAHAISDFEQDLERSALDYSARFFTEDLSVIPFQARYYSAEQRPLDSESEQLWRVHLRIPACYDATARAMLENSLVIKAVACAIPYNFIHLIVRGNWTKEQIQLFVHNVFIPF